MFHNINSYSQASLSGTSPQNHEGNAEQIQDPQFTEDLYDNLLNKTTEDIVAGLQATNEFLSRNRFAGSTSAAQRENQEVTIESLLEEDPLLSFTTTMDRVESNDTVLQNSSPLSGSLEPERIVQALTLNESQVSPTAAVPAPLQSFPIQSMHQNPQVPVVYPSAPFVLGNAPVQGGIPLSEVHLQQHQHNLLLQQQQQQNQQHQMNQTLQQDGFLKQQFRLEQHHEQQILASQFKAQIQNQEMFLPFNNGNSDLHGNVTQPPNQNVIVENLPPHMQPQIVTSQVQVIPQPSDVAQQDLIYTPVQEEGPFSTRSKGFSSPLTQVQPPLSNQKQRIRSRSQVSKKSSSSPPTPPVSKNTSTKPPLAKRPVKPPMNRSSSATNLNRVQKNSFSGASNAVIGTTSKILLKKSKSFVSTPTVSAKPLYGTLDFSKNFNNFLNSPKSGSVNPKDGLIKPFPQNGSKKAPQKNFEFVFENTGDKERLKTKTTPRKSLQGNGSISAPPSARMPKFSKPPLIDTSLYSPNSSSPTNSDASGASPLNSASIRTGQGAINSSAGPLTLQKISPESYPGSVNSSAENINIAVKPKKKSGAFVKTGVAIDPNMHLKEMKMGMIEFKVNPGR